MYSKGLAEFFISSVGTLSQLFELWSMLIFKSIESIFIKDLERFNLKQVETYIAKTMRENIKSKLTSYS